MAWMLNVDSSADGTGADENNKYYLSDLDMHIEGKRMSTDLL